ncbi:MAG: ABC transporter substrate-binding protein [Chthoniobacter sp.]|uniref:ABC transporter substrate-binding protein n=1 Tax=Chthoniobacter sp. TaxID=2510640 RepID=UPI0032A8460B
MNLKSLFTAALAFAFAANLHADPIKIGYSDWPGYTVLEVAKQKGWFKDAGLDVELVWFDYLPSLDAFSANKIDAVCVVGSDALVTGATGGKSKIIALLDYSEGSDMIVGAPGINSIKDLKGKKIGIEVTLVEHMLLLQALKDNGMKQSDVELVNTPTNDTPQVLGSGKVAAIGAWYPISGQALKAVAGSKPLFTSAEAKGLIYDVLAVNPTSYAKHKEEWSKIAGIYYKCVDYLKDSKTAEDAVKIMAAKVGANAEDYAKNIPGTHFLTLAEAKTAYKKGDGLDSIYGALTIGNKFNMDNKVYKVSQKPENYLVPGVVAGLK